MSVKYWLYMMWLEWWRLILVRTIAIDLRRVVTALGTTGYVLLYCLLLGIRNSLVVPNSDPCIQHALEGRLLE